MYACTLSLSFVLAPGLGLVDASRCGGPEGDPGHVLRLKHRGSAARAIDQSASARTRVRWDEIG